MIDKLGGLKLPPFQISLVSGPSLCPGHLYRVDSRSDEHRAEVLRRDGLGCSYGSPSNREQDDAPGRIVIVGDVDQINNFIQPKIRLLAQAWASRSSPIPAHARSSSADQNPCGRLRATAMMAVLWLKAILVILPPYVLAGMAISLALTRSPWPIDARLWSGPHWRGQLGAYWCWR